MIELSGMLRRLTAPREILVLGDVNVDIIARVKSFPEPGEECLAHSLELHCGGVGANYAFALRQWSISPRLLSCIGQDDFAVFLLRTLANYGVDVSNIQRTSAAMTGLLYINVTPNGQRTFFGSRGANRFLRRLPSSFHILNRAMALSMMGYSFLDPGPEGTAKQLLKAVRARGGWISLDVGMAPSEQIPNKILQIIKRVDLLFVSSQEAAVLTGIRDPRKSFHHLQRAGACNVVMKANYVMSRHLRCARLTLPGLEMLLPPLSSKRVYVAGPISKLRSLPTPRERQPPQRQAQAKTCPPCGKSPISCAPIA
jgi:sugar/nucleoside kinase (ribokinase family)